MSYTLDVIVGAFSMGEIHMNIGFIGLGTMGLPMVRNLLKDGWKVRVVSRSRGPIDEAVALGATEADSPQRLAEQSDMILTCLPMPDTIEQVYLGKDGIIKGIPKGAVAVDHSTVSPELNRKIAEALRDKGARFLDAPISGGPMGAAAGTLTIMVGGEEDAFHIALPVLQSMGRHITRLGPVGSGSIVKLINNNLVAIHTAALSEAFAFGAKAGISSEALLNVLKNSTGYSTMMDRVIPLVQQRDFSPKFSVKLLNKDMGLAVEMSKQMNVHADWMEKAASVLQEAVQLGFAEEDIAAIVKVYERIHHIEVSNSGS